MSDSLTRFTNRVDDYAKYRPTYPGELLTFLETTLGMSPPQTIVDIGAGTGISSEPFLERGHTVMAVEPNATMRSAADQRLSRFQNYSSHEGTAEATGLPDQCARWTVAAQAYHWFDPARAKEEFRRIKHRDGYVLLIWNDRRTSGDALHEGYEQILLEFGTDYTKVRHNNVTEASLAEFLGRDYGTQTFLNTQVFDDEGLIGRVASSSYAPSRDDPRFAPMTKALERLFLANERNGQITIGYDTKLFYGRL